MDRLDPQPLITYRYLRMSLVAVLVMLFAAVVRQTVTDHAWQPSISDYYWTPARNVFVGALVALGAGMLVLKPDSELEDVALNISGILAPLVAFVPNPEPGTCDPLPGGGFSTPSANTVAGIGNNVVALFVAGLAGLILLGLSRFVPEKVRFPELTRQARLGRRLGFVAVAVIFGYAVAWYFHDHLAFQCQAHLRAAFTLFGFIIVVVFLNALGVSRDTGTRRPARRNAWLNIYSVIFVAMILGLVSAWFLRRQDWAYWVLYAEAVELGLFLVFWITQTLELWNRGLRSSSAGPRELLPQSGEAAPR
jgi:hypothetical protein